MDDHYFFLTPGKTDVEPLQSKVVIDLVCVVPIQLAGENIGEPIFLCCCNERIENYLAFLALARIERHNFQPQLIIDLVRSWMFMNKLADKCLLFGMGCNHADTWRWLCVKKPYNAINDAASFKGVYVSLIDQSIVFNGIKFDHVLDRFPAD